MSSSSFAKRTLGQAHCFCKVDATLRYSSTPRNPGRPFLGCPKYNTEGLPYCKFFKWADSNQEIELHLQERNNDLLRREKEVEKTLDDVEKMKTELRKRVDEIEKKELVVLNREIVVSTREKVLLEQETVMRRGRTLHRVFWAFLFVVAFYLVVYK
ncbi:uncharacterized protein LOC121234474 [Juglans microcarpa x Juglans regia]|uniref:uncharacterized protein LOC121234474 n=1 Tax=Juglans microcarpa x Juglans regia TaxID=2249226 RepID=UPI001B7ECA5E|nr:uncharacterized protein LOC121234474 [Juglans microcarpa x Juglans regia]